MSTPREILEGGTQGPWFWLPEDGQFIVHSAIRGDPRAGLIVAEISCQSGNPADGKCIVMAVNVLPELVEWQEKRLALEEFNERDCEDPGAAYEAIRRELDYAADSLFAAIERECK